MNIFEATTNEKDILTKISTMTLDEFYDWQNEDGKSHSSKAYHSTIKSLNHNYDISYLRTTKDAGGYSYDIYYSDNALFFTHNNRLDAIYDKNTNEIYFTPMFRLSSIDVFHLPKRHYDIEYEVFQVKSRNKVKYISDISKRYNNVVEQNIKRYPVILNRKLFGDEYLTIRMESEQKEKDLGITTVVLNEQGLVVAMASNEWGATLIQVAEEYNGKGIGKILLDVWTHNNPRFTSGGYTEHGLALSEKQWRSAVSRSLAQGMYTELIKSGEITLDKVKKIVASAKIKPVVNKKIHNEVPKSKREDSPVIYSDDTAVYIFDTILFELDLHSMETDEIENFIYAHGFLRDNVYDEVIIYSFDYTSEKYRKILLYSLLQASTEYGGKIKVNAEGSDIIGDYNLANIEIDGDYISLTKNVIDLNKNNKIVKMLQSKYDRYDEKLAIILEASNSKWNNGEEF